jgi:hypothetical protein
VYALGALLYELLTGRPPFRAASLVETMDQIRHQDPVPPRRLNPAIPQDLETICTTCLAKDPKRRYPTMDALSDDLGRWREGRPIAARPISMAERAWRWARRRPLTAALGAALTATVVVGMLSLLVLWRRADGERRRAEALRDVARANYEVASQSLREICEITYRTMLEPKSGVSYPPYLERTLEQTRARQIELSRKNALDPSGQEQLATVDLTLAVVYRGLRNREDDARRLLHESMGLWEACIARGADPNRAREQQFLALESLASLGKGVSGEAELHRWEAMSTSVYRRYCGDRDAEGLLFQLSYRERQMADYMAGFGQADRARRFLRERLGLYESLLASDRDSPDFLLARALTLTALGDEGQPGRLGPVGNATPGGPRHAMVVLAIAELAARRYGLRALGPNASDRAHPERDDTAWAEQVTRFLGEQASRVGLDREALPAIAWQMREMITSMGSHLRSGRKHEEARRIARLFNALAAEFVRTCPGRVEPYLLVSEAHLQDAKNAARAGDSVAVGLSIRRALEAALQAQAVAPDSEEARRFVVDRRQRLADFESKRK